MSHTPFRCHSSSSPSSVLCVLRVACHAAPLARYRLTPVPSAAMSIMFSALVALVSRAAA